MSNIEVIFHFFSIVMTAGGGFGVLSSLGG